jgi:hypothetical protein
MRHIYGKLGVQQRAAAVERAGERGLPAPSSAKRSAQRPRESSKKIAGMKGRSCTATVTRT